MEVERLKGELAGLRARVEAAPACEVTREDWLENCTQFGPHMIGQRVRLLTDTKEALDGK